MSEYPQHPAAFPIDRLLVQCDMEFVRRSGPGGQHRNKVSTGVVVTHRSSGVKAEANERRSQSANRAVAIFRLRVNLALEIRTLRQPGDLPSPLWKSRSGNGRIEVNPRHECFSTLLAEALDAIAMTGFDPKRAAATLGCSVSQLVKFLKKEPRALARVNRERMLLGLHPLQ